MTKEEEFNKRFEKKWEEYEARKKAEELEEKIKEEYQKYLFKRLENILITEDGSQEVGNKDFSLIRDFDALKNEIGEELANKLKNRNTALQDKGIVEVTKSFIRIYYGYQNGNKVDPFVFCREPDLNGYSLHRTIIGKFRLKNGKDSFVLKNEPVKVFGSNYVLVFRKGENDRVIDLYDREKKEAIDTFIPSITTFTKNLIIHYAYGINEAFLYYNGHMYDISRYYYREVYQKNKRVTGIIEGINLYKFSDFKDSFDIQKLLDEEKKKDQKHKELLEEIRAEEFKEQREKEKKMLEIKREMLKEVAQDSLKGIEECDEKLGVINDDKYVINKLFIDHGKYKEINPLCFVLGLKFFDFSGVPLRRVRLKGLDLSETFLELI